MSTNNKLFEKMLNYVFNVELFLKHMLLFITNNWHRHLGGWGSLKRWTKDIYIYEDRKENIPVMGW